MPCVINKKLSNLISNVSFFCACLVVGLHVNVVVPAENSADYTCHWRLVEWMRGGGLGDWAVPIFFVISGFLISGHMGEEGYWGREIKKRLRSLIVPFVIWNVAYLVFRMSLTSVAAIAGQNFDGGHWSDLNIVRFCRTIGLNPFVGMELSPLWFVRCLIVFALILPFFSFMRFRYVGVLLVISLFVIYGLLPNWLPPASDWQVHFHKLCWVRGFAYYALGVWMRWRGWTLVEAFMSLGIVKILGKCFECFVREWPKWMTGSAFPIFLIHEFVLTSFIAVFRVLGIKELMVNSWWSWWIQMLGAIVVSVAFTVVIRTIVPRTAAVLFGGR